MKFKYYIIAPIHGLIDEGLRQPICLFSGLYLIFNFSLRSAILFILTIIFAVINHHIMILRHDRNSTIESLFYFDNFNGCSFKRLSLNDIIKCYDDVKEVLYILRPVEDVANLGIGFFVNYEKPINGKIPITFTSFPKKRYDSIIVFPDDPLVLNPIQRFKFFHELGHLSYGHLRAKVMFNHAIVQSVILTFLVSTCLKGYPYILACLYICIGAWLYNYFILDQYFFERKVSERMADGFAISRLYDKDEFIKIENAYKDMYNDNQWNESFDYYKSWSKDPVNIEDNRILNRLFPKTFIKRHLSDKVINYSSAIGKFFTPKPAVNLLLLISITFAAFFSSNISIIELVTYAIILTILPILYIVRLRVQSAVYMQKVNESIVE